MLDCTTDASRPLGSCEAAGRNLAERRPTDKEGTVGSTSLEVCEISPGEHNILSVKP